MTNKQDEYINILIGIFGDKIGKKSEKVAKDILDYLSQGKPVDIAVDASLAKNRIPQFLKNEITDILITVTGISRGVSIQAIVNKPDLKKFYLDRTWPGEELTLSKKINKLAYKNEIKSVIKAGLYQGKQFEKVAEDLTDLNLNRGPIDKRVGKLANAAEGMLRRMNLPEDARKEIEKDWKTALSDYEAHLKKLSTTSPYQNLRAGRNEILDQAKELNVKAMNASITQNVKDKMRYNALRISHTESRKAFNLQSVDQLVQDDDVVAYKFKLGNYSGHHFDICDLYTKADLWGMGPGVSPKDKINHIPPVHPWCRCSLIGVYASEIKSGKFNPKGVSDYLDKLKDDDLKSLLGVEAYQAYKEGDKSVWQESLKGYESPHKIELGKIVQPKFNKDLLKKYPLDKDLRPFAKP